MSKKRIDYESEADLVNEARAQVYIERHFKVVAYKMPVQYRIDFALFLPEKKTLWAVAEYKCRADVATTDYKTIILSVSKYFAGMNWVRNLGCKFMFIVEFSDGLYAVDVPMFHRDHVMWGGRTDRDDWQDEEPVVHIQATDFKRMIKWEDT